MENKFEYSLPSNALSQVWLKFVHLFWKGIFSKRFNILFCYYRPLNGHGSIYLNELQFPEDSRSLSLVWLKLTNMYLEKFFESCQLSFTNKSLFIPLVRNVALSLNKLEFPSAKDALSQVKSVDIDQLVLGELKRIKESI